MGWGYVGVTDLTSLVDYDPAWPELFAREARRIGAALGDRAVEIEHVGSTAVPGLAAKPVIDILLVVANSADEETYVPASVSVLTGNQDRETEPAVRFWSAFFVLQRWSRNRTERPLHSAGS